MSLLLVAMTLACLFLAVPAWMLLFEVWSARRAARRPQDPALSRRHEARVAVLIPAHNEAGGISATLASVAAQLNPSDRILVVADNCSDDTAAVARAAGVEVIERTHQTQRGKGYALDFGVRHLAANPPQVVIIVDADCTLGSSCISLLSNYCLQQNKPIQARYLMRYPERAGGLGARIAEFAFVVKNWVRPLGLAHWGLPCPLLGSGMAFPWQTLNGVELASGNIVEDMRLGSDLVAAQMGPLFLASATVDSTFPAAIEGQASQRKRWEHGHLQTLLTQVPKLLWRGASRAKLAIFVYGLDLAIAPLALLGMLLVALNLFASLGWVFGLSLLPLLIALSGLLAMTWAVVLAWSRFGRDIVSAAELAAVPAYAARKIPVYLRFVVARQTSWVRSRRDHE